RRVVERLQKAEVDLADYRRQSLDYYAGKDLAKKVEEHKKAQARREAVVAATRKAGGVTFAIAASRLVERKINGLALGLEAAPDEVVKLAEEADAAASSVGTRGELISALWYRAHRGLMKDDAQYAALAAKTQRSLGTALLTFALAREGPMRDKALAR